MFRRLDLVGKFIIYIYIKLEPIMLWVILLLEIKVEH